MVSWDGTKVHLLRLEYCTIDVAGKFTLASQGGLSVLQFTTNNNATYVAAMFVTLG